MTPVSACDLLTTDEVALVMGFDGATNFDGRGDVCKFVAVEERIGETGIPYLSVVFGDCVAIVSGVLGPRSLREFAETFEERVGVEQDGAPLAFEFGEEVEGLGDEARAATTEIGAPTVPFGEGPLSVVVDIAGTTEIGALAVRVGQRVFVIGVFGGRDFAAEVRELAEIAATRP